MFIRTGANKEKFRDMEADLKMQKLLGQKQKNSNERELERFIEEKRQEDIKQQLEAFRKERRKELFKGDLLKSPSIFKHKNTVLSGGSPVLDGPNMFMQRGNMF